MIVARHEGGFAATSIPAAYDEPSILRLISDQTLALRSVDQRGEPAGNMPMRVAVRVPHTFDRVLLLDVLEHVSEREAFLDHALRLLAPEGRMLLTVPAHSWLWTRHDRIN